MISSPPRFRTLGAAISLALLIVSPSRHGLFAQTSSPPGPPVFLASWNSGVGEEGAGFAGDSGQVCASPVLNPYPKPKISLLRTNVPGQGGLCRTEAKTLTSDQPVTAPTFGGIGSSHASADTGNLAATASPSYHTENPPRSAIVFSGVVYYQQDLPASVDAGNEMTLTFRVVASLPESASGALMYALVSEDAVGVVRASVSHTIEYNVSTTEQITTKPLMIGFSKTYSLYLSVSASAVAPSTARMMVGGGDSVTPQSSTGVDQIGILVNGKPQDGTQWNHETFRSSEIDPTIFLGRNVVPSSTANGNEVVAFSKQRPLILLENAPWTENVDDLLPEFKPEISLPLQIWVVSGDYAARSEFAMRMVAWANHVWRQERVGLQLKPVNIVDATAFPGSQQLWNVSSRSAGELESNVGKTNGMINVYLVNTINVAELNPPSGIKLLDGELPAIALAQWAGLGVLVHELGHALELRHPCENSELLEGTCVNDQFFNRTNVMWWESDGAAKPWKPHTYYWSGAQLVVAVGNPIQLLLFEASISSGLVAGRTGNIEPSWPSTSGAKVTDDEVVWTNKGSPTSYQPEAPAQYLTEGQIFRALLATQSPVNKLYNKRPGDPTRDCPRDEVSLQCPAYYKRIWDDGRYRAQ